MQRVSIWSTTIAIENEQVCQRHGSNDGNVRSTPRASSGNMRGNIRVYVEPHSAVVQPLAVQSANVHKCSQPAAQPPCTNADNQPSRMMQNKSKGNILIYFSIFCWKTVQISCIVKFKEKWQVIYYLARVHTICYREWAYVCLSIIDERRRRKVK